MGDLSVAVQQAQTELSGVFSVVNATNPDVGHPGWLNIKTVWLAKAKLHVDLCETMKLWVFFRMRKRHLLPALHDGMQGDEDGMQTCERPPLGAFGWPRGGVHMFTSLHVACLARVA